MVLIAFDCANENLRGLLTRWLLEIKPGVFLGNITTAVREELWRKVIVNLDKYEGAILAYSTNTEQGFNLEYLGNPKKVVIDLEGVKLIKTLK